MFLRSWRQRLAQVGIRPQIQKPGRPWFFNRFWVTPPRCTSSPLLVRRYPGGTLRVPLPSAPTLNPSLRCCPVRPRRKGPPRQDSNLRPPTSQLARPVLYQLSYGGMWIRRYGDVRRDVDTEIRRCTVQRAWASGGSLVGAAEPGSQPRPCLSLVSSPWGCAAPCLSLPWTQPCLACVGCPANAVGVLCRLGSGLVGVRLLVLCRLPDFSLGVGGLCVARSGCVLRLVFQALLRGAALS